MSLGGPSFVRVISCKNVAGERRSVKNKSRLVYGCADACTEDTLRILLSPLQELSSASEALEHATSQKSIKRR